MAKELLVCNGTVDLSDNTCNGTWETLYLETLLTPQAVLTPSDIAALCGGFLAMFAAAYAIKAISNTIWGPNS